MRAGAPCGSTVGGGGGGVGLATGLGRRFNRRRFRQSVVDEADAIFVGNKTAPKP